MERPRVADHDAQTGWPRTGSGMNSSDGAVISAHPAPTSSGAVGHEVAEVASTPAAIGAGYISIPPSTSGPTGWSPKSNSVTTPKFPPPPRVPQNSSSFSDSDAVRIWPSAVTISIDRRLSQVSPHFRSIQPEPLPRASPAIPVPSSARRSPPGHAPGSRRRSRPRCGPPRRGRSRLGIDLDAFMGRRSIITPPSQTALPVTL